MDKALLPILEGELQPRILLSYSPRHLGVHYQTYEEQHILVVAEGRPLIFTDREHGMSISLECGKGQMVYYKHIFRPLAIDTAWWYKGDVLALAMPDYLHFEIRVNGILVDPETYQWNSGIIIKPKKKERDKEKRDRKNRRDK